MKKFQFLFLLCLIFSLVPAQTPYSKIPWATVQPQFVFPLYFEDGVGQKDTLYLGYDDSASVYSFEIQDTIFGVNLRPVDTSKFYVVWDSFLCGTSWCVEGYKANVTALNQFTGTSSFAQRYYFSCNQGVLPLKISWDSHNFSSDSLPFPSHIGAPRAQGRLYFNCNNCFARENNIQVSPINGEYIICDTSCNLRDSVTIFNVFGQQDSLVHGNYSFYIQEWSNGFVGISEMQGLNTDYKVESYGENIKITNSGNSIVHVRIVDLLGRVLLNEKIFPYSTFDTELPRSKFLIIHLYNSKLSNFFKIYTHEIH